jgi:hypothetical protein
MGVGKRFYRHFVHCRERARERYGLDLTLFDYRWLCGQIERADSANTRFMVRQTFERSIWLLRVNGIWCVVAWSEQYRNILSFLPITSEFDDNTGAPLLTVFRKAR